jgi:hypothetical protein
MATQYSTDHYIPPMPTEALVLRAHRVLERHGITLYENAEVWIDDQDADEPIPEYVATGIEDAARYLSRWPYAGRLQYSLQHPSKDPNDKAKGYVVNVYYTPRRELSTLGFAFIGNAFKADKFPDTLPLITTVVETLHEEFSAYRSGFGWGLSDDVREEDEVLDLLNRRAEPRPGQWLDIIDNALVTPEVLERYQAAVKTGSILRRTANGSLFWQRDPGPP